MDRWSGLHKPRCLGAFRLGNIDLVPDRATGLEVLEPPIWLVPLCLLLPVGLLLDHQSRVIVGLPLLQPSGLDRHRSTAVSGELHHSVSHRVQENLSERRQR